MSELTPEFVEDRIDEVVKGFIPDLEEVIGLAVHEAYASDPSGLVEEVRWWVEMHLSEALKDAILGESFNA